MQLYPNLTFNGQCEAAFKLYEQCLGGKITFMVKYKDTPMEAPPDDQDKIVHSTFMLGNFMLSGADVLPARYQKPQGFGLQLNLGDPLEAERIFNTLAENGTVQMPLQQTFWADRFGVLTDRFGIPWLINCENAA